MLDYLKWQSKLSLETVFIGSESINYPQLWHAGMLYLTVLQAEQGRVVVMYRQQNEVRCITPAPFNLRSKFSEYGGKPFWVFGDTLFFVNQADQCLYQQNLLEHYAAAPKRLTPLPNDAELLMHAEVVEVSPSILLAVVEQEHTGSIDDRENICFVAAIDLEKPDEPVHKLMQGADFYSNLCIDNARQTVAWVQWNHPNMPWDGTQLWVADLRNHQSRVGFANARRIKLKESASVCQLVFANNGKLFFSADFAGEQHDSSKNYWNIYVLDLTEKNSEITQVTHAQQEFGYPHWQYGDARIVQYDANTLISFASTAIGDVLYKINQDSLELEVLGDVEIGFQNLSATGDGRAAVMLLSKSKPPRAAVLTQKDKRFEPAFDVPNPLQDTDTSEGEHFKFPTRDGDVAYGLIYAPTNSTYPQACKPANPPPLIVMVHGGPTACAYRFFDIQKQFWTQRGFAVFDVNHRGSTGYGRAFRDALYGHWGETDTSDIIDGINYLVSQAKVDRGRVCIRGKSAGGYAVLRALTEFPTVFKAGACYYGIGNLVTLAETTHKFEKHYADRMVGEAFDVDKARMHDSLFYQRSPINKINQLQSAMIVFQGLQDRVVPPAVALEIIDALKTLGLEHFYVEYANEGHGFRHAENNIDACSKELEFYRANLT